MKKKFICTVCGYIHEGTEAPAECPVCHAKAAKFKEFNPEALRVLRLSRTLRTLSQVRARHTLSISTMLQRQRRTAMSRLQVSSRRQHATRRSMLRFGSSSSMVVISLQQP